jgi:hypothetical protein
LWKWNFAEATLRWAVQSASLKDQITGAPPLRKGNSRGAPPPGRFRHFVAARRCVTSVLRQRGIGRGPATYSPCVSVCQKKLIFRDFEPHSGSRSGSSSTCNDRPHIVERKAYTRNPRATNRDPGIMEPAGVEPASANRSLSASTCVARLVFFSLAHRRGERPFTSQPLSTLAPGAVASPESQPDSIVA